MAKGFWLSLDAVLGLALLLLLLSSAPFTSPGSLAPLLIAQQQFDLLKLWQTDELFLPQTWESDALELFSANGFQIWVEGEPVASRMGFDWQESSAVEGLVHGKRVLFVVYY